jgi:hypothetical protein
MTDKEQYEKELKRKQHEHLARVQGFVFQNWKPCLHEACPECYGTGIKVNGSSCVHNISCNCPRCSASYSILF